MSLTPIRILFVSHDGSMAGAQQTLLTLLEGIDRDIFAPHLVVPYQGELAERVAKLGISVTTRQLLHWAPCIADVPRHDRWKHLWRSLRSLRERTWAVAALIERFRIDLVYTNTVTCVEGALAARMTGRPHVWHIHEPLAGNSELTPLLPLWLYSAAINMLSARIIFPSFALARSYPALRAKSSVIHNGLPLASKQDRMAARNEVATHLGVDATRRWVAVVGAIQPRKDHQTFLRAAKAILANRQDVEFLIIGSGAEHLTQQVREQIFAMGLSERVSLAGRWLGPINTVLSAIDVLVISSEQESFGLTAIESLGQETPVVSTRCGGPEEIIEDGTNGYLVDIKDGDAMANSILALLNDSQMAQSFGATGRFKVARMFTQERYVEGIQDILLDVCGQPKLEKDFPLAKGKEA